MPMMRISRYSARPSLRVSLPPPARQAPPEMLRSADLIKTHDWDRARSYGVSSTCLNKAPRRERAQGP